MIRFVGGLLVGLSLIGQPAVADDSTAEDALDAIVSERLEYYARSFPTIEFAHLRGGEDAMLSTLWLRQLLGRGATNLVYEHPAELSSDLMDVSLRRIQYMLSTDSASSSLFRVGEGAAARHSELCVITLSPQTVAANDRVATNYMLPVDSAALPQMPTDHLLDHRMHLEFVVDHEVFHCLDAHQNGPIPMSDREHWGEFMAHVNEHGADAFAVAMHVQRHGDHTDYSRNLMRVRALTLLGDDSSHFTPESIHHMLDRIEDSKILSEMTPNALITLAHWVRNEVVGDYDDYLRFRSAAQSAVLQTAHLAETHTAAIQTAPFGPESSGLADSLVSLTSSCYTAMFDTPLDATPMPSSECDAYLQ